MKLDILVFAAHPDDAELGCAGTIMAHLAAGKKVGIIDFTCGELGTRGTIETRREEAAEATRIMGLTIRENLGFRDGFFENNEKHQLEVIHTIRKYQPEIVIGNAIRDRHPDHAKASQLTKTACFLSGLKKIETTLDGKIQEAWRPKNIFYFIQSDYIKPDLVVDISYYWERKMQAVAAYKTQFFNSESTEKEQTFISTPDFMKFFEGRAHEMGQSIRVKYGEGFTIDRQIGVKNLFDLI